ncbi:hypothetical protein RRG08_047698 [Elysia crispata]|uniref:Major facilitator superfamily (MFS) profile domain-containing protein n=1 Tax=Elysia crispata TaxID=231223 RepID=A0AAE0ZSD4_9GAST|nr:hypothetical protein RRG08_047698 [Elysia crispata]
MQKNCNKVFVLIGASLVASPLSLVNYFGNLLPYLASYNNAYRNKMYFYVDPLWTASAFCCTFITSMIFTSPIELRFGIRRCILAGDIVLWVSLMSGYFTVKEPMALTLIFGGVQGIAVGILYSLATKILLQTMLNQGGLSTGIMSLGMVFGTFVSIGVAFAVINPGNKEPNLTVDKKVYFSDKNLIDRVPIYFLSAGAIMVFFNVFGTVLLFMGSSNIAQEEDQDETPSVITSINNQMSKLNHNDSTVANSKNSALDQGHFKQYEYGACTYGSHSSIIRVSTNEDQGESSLESKEDRSKFSSPNEKSPGQVIKTAKFWFVWLGYVCSHHTTYLYLNLYKQYGERAIPNDASLTTTGLISNAGMAIVCLLVGIASDKFGIRTMNVIFHSASCLFLCLMVVGLHICPLMYMVLVIIENLAVSPQTMLFTLLAAFEFGKTHCASNMGLVRSGYVLLLLIEPFIVDAMLRTVGWDWTFLTGALTAAIATVSIMSLDLY